MMTLNNHLPEITTSKIRQFDAYCNRFENVIRLTLGQPLFPTPSPVKAKAIEAINHNITYYTPNTGAPAAIEAVLEYCKAQLNLQYAKDEIILTVGSSEALTVVLRTLLNDGDEVLIPAPVYPGYEPLVKLYGATVKPVDTSANGFELTPDVLEQYVTPRTKCIIITDPNNPTGAMISRKNRDALADFLAEKDIYIIADEVYNRIIYTDDYRSFGTYEKLREKLIIVNSFSKSHSMTGWRIGYLLACRSLLQQLTKAHQYYVTSACSVTQYALQAVNDPQTETELAAMVRSYKACRDYAYSFITQLGFGGCKPQGAFYLFASIDKFGRDSDTFCRRLVEEQGVAVISGSSFGEAYGNYIRISYCVDLDLLKKALDKVKLFVERW
ncbi:MAG: aminotransferase class I/II-fold pyridoxal phosphate-dependent enzyme [Prevotellaceae bacterium]|jgi:aminotransferase|nr:aminotransferase class I/II-fold pyridoxal phosphate-dependent enzyme [Prevotellaceae bacterium]